VIVDHAPVGLPYLSANQQKRENTRPTRYNEKIQKPTFWKKAALKPIHEDVPIGPDFL
jgi:hypothetical protein